MIQTSIRGQKNRIKRRRLKALSGIHLNETHPLGNRATRRRQVALLRKDSRPKKTYFIEVDKKVDGKLVENETMRVVGKHIQTKGAFGKCRALNI